MTSNSATKSRIAARMTLNGHVQGIGLRPAVVRWAQQLSLAGYVGNTRGGVEIHVEGAEPKVARFERELPVRLPAFARITSLDKVRVPPVGFDTFVVQNASHQPGDCPDASPSVAALSVRVPADIVVCEACRRETADRADRRYQYAFVSCTNCGPRYSIIERMPYERAQTSMNGFPLCATCRREDESPGDRRFHAQTNACPECGPRIWLVDGSGRFGPRDASAVDAAADAIRDGEIVALRGLGGYQLLVDATSPSAVERLRARKRRHGKPLAVMVASLAEASRLATVDETERPLLEEPGGPIVVVRVRSGNNVAAAVSEGLDTIGLMLPTTPLHAMLLHAVERPVVCTSGNVESEPLAYESEAAFEKLSGIADVWLEHNRPILRPIDDSVMRVIAGRPVSLRLARGYAPLELELHADEPIVAVGGHQKSSVALFNGEQAILGPHCGDLDTITARQRYLEQFEALSELYDTAAPLVACDLHPEYFTTQWAQSQIVQAAQVQHHHAHIVAGMCEHGWLNRQVLGVAFDGTGYGSDGTIWGGEFLLATDAHCERVGHLRPFPLAGGDQAVRQPWRVATALVREAEREESAVGLGFSTADVNSLLAILRRPALSPRTTSAGRLFDGAAALILGIEQVQFEGQAAMLLEAVVDPLAVGQYDLPLQGSGPRQLDWRPLVRQILRDRGNGISPSTMATRFHRAVASAVVAMCRCFPNLPVVLGGGVFQNRVLVELVAENLLPAGQPLGLPGRIPPNDGGLAAGQLAVAAAKSRQRSVSACV